MNCDYNTFSIILFLVLICFIYCIYEINNLKKKSIEGFTTTNDAAINTAVKKIYLADVEAIRLLSNFAIQLSQGGTTVPGNVTFAGNVNVTGNTTLTGSLQIGQWTIFDRGDGLGFNHNGALKYFMFPSGTGIWTPGGEHVTFTGLNGRTIDFRDGSYIYKNADGMGMVHGGFFHQLQNNGNFYINNGIIQSKGINITG